jgi:hypothetical protein
MEKIVKIEGLVYDTKKNIYFLKQFEDGVYICKAEWSRKGRRKKE